MPEQQREHWIDTLKAICIICVYIAHCESFYSPSYNLSKLIVSPFYVNAFFFINGYLIVRKYFKNDKINNYSLKEYKDNIKNILYRLAIPTIIFSAIIYLPKNHFNFDLQNFCTVILGGVSLWFTSALCVSQFVIYTLFLSKQNNIWLYVFITFLIFIVTNIFGDIRSKSAEEYFPWFWQTGLIYTSLMMLGGMYYTFEKKIDYYLNKTAITTATFIILAGLMLLAGNGVNMYFLGLSGRSNILGYTTTLLSIISLIYITKRIANNKITDFIGKQSIVFYFLSGAVPSTLLFVIDKLPYKNSYIVLVIYILSSITMSYIAAYIILRFFPFLLDIRKAIKKR